MEKIATDIYTFAELRKNGFTYVFTDMKITPCAWKAHEGQQPD